MRHRSPRWWRNWGLTWATWAAGWGAFDAVEHDWLQLGLVSGFGAVNMAASRYMYRHAREGPAPPHRPDYAKIARLEIELGLVEPPALPAVTLERRPPVPLVTRPMPEQGPNGKFRYGGPVFIVPPGWDYCPVCTRTHEGRCAG